MNIKEIEKLGNRWQKNGMDRVYISRETLEKVCEKYNEGIVPLNRRQRDSFKIWIDLATGEVDAKNIGRIYDDDIKAWVKAYIETI